MSDSNFERTLDLYKSNLVQYKISGNSGFKIAAENAKKWLDEYVANMQAGVEKDGKEIQKFVENYAKSDEEIAKLKQDMSTIRKDGPELQAIYETERESQKEIPVDYTLYYTKGAVLAGIAGLVLVANMF
jgi:outer membrane translocation and assembly module TamA